MAFGAGALLGTVSQLAVSAQQHAGTARTAISLLVGALLFSLVNAWLAAAGARNRKRCGECAPQENERDRSGSGQAIAIGTIIDAFPEGLVLGMAVANSVAQTVAVVAGRHDVFECAGLSKSTSLTSIMVSLAARLCCFQTGPP